MRLQDWDVTVQNIIDELNHERKQAGKRRIVTQWRVRLEGEPILLQPYQIDQIMREVSRRLGNVNR
jgi:coproporphyrinogen III oxidase-like Fe-S oxidoreductase